VRAFRALALAGGVLLMVAAPGGAEVLTPADAVRETLALDPEVRIALAKVAERQGQYLEFSGAFDGVAFADSTLDYNRIPLSGETLKEERNRRIQLELVERFFGNASEALEDFLCLSDPAVNPETCDQVLFDTNSLFFLNNQQRTLNPCGPTQTTVEIDLGTSIDGVDQGKVNLCFNSGNDFGSLTSFGAKLVCSPECESDPACKRAKCDQIDLDVLRTLIAMAQLDSLSGALETIGFEARALLEDQARIALTLVRRVEEAARFARRRLGGLPDELETYDFSTRLGYRHRLNNGIGISPSLELRALEDNFSGKLRIVGFGDLTKSNLFQATARLSADLPLGKNSGRTAVRAAVLAGEANLQAAQALAVQTASDQSLRTLRAYWNLAAAAERVATLQRSVELKESADRSVGDLIEGGEMPRVERSRSTGQLAQRRSDLAAARQQLEVARAELAKEIGLPGDAARVAALEAVPLESLVIPAIDPAQAGTIAGEALRRRADVIANDRLVEANEFLRRAARVNLRPEVTLAVNVSYSGLEETFDERYYDVEGFWKAAAGKTAGPSYGVALRFTVPVGNNEARGRLVQAEANLGTSEIQRADLRRTIGLRVHELAASTERARREVEARRVALDEQQRSVDASFERLRGGDLSVIDALTTEDQLTEARLGWIEAMRSLLELESRLRFETNTLLSGAEPDADPRSLQLAPLEQPLF
jgi:outer membrane protein TolC